MRFATKLLVTALLTSLSLAVLSFAQQQPPPDPNLSRPTDNASFGNQKSPKKDKAPTARVVTGQVTDETGQVLEGAMVTLTDTRTKQKTSFFTKKDGRYHFEDLSFVIDYEVQARYKDKLSDTRKISQFDRTPRPVRILEINTETPATAAAAAKQ